MAISLGLFQDQGRQQPDDTFGSHVYQQPVLQAQVRRPRPQGRVSSIPITSPFPRTSLYAVADS